MAPTQSVFLPVNSALAQMIQSLQNNGSLITDFTTGSGTRNLFESFATVLSNQSATADQLQLDSYLDTATGTALDALGTDNWQVPRLPAVQATGQVTITRQSTSGAMTLPAGFTQLVASPTVPGGTGIAVTTTADADFASGTASVAVTAQAVLGGVAGNLSSGTFLTPAATVNGVSSQNGFEVTTSFTNGVDAESDNAYRFRIPLVVQGRVKGQVTSYLAAALSVPGVLAAAVLPAGSLRGDGSTIPAGSVEVYYRGSLGLLAAVQSGIAGASTVNQNPTAYASVNLASPRGPQRVVASFTVYCLSGVDPVATGLAVAAALQGYINGLGIGKTAYLAQAIQSIITVPGIVSIGILPTQFSLFGSSGAADIAIPVDSYANLAAGDVTVVVNTLPS